jgi:hypothetical protein
MHSEVFEVFEKGLQEVFGEMSKKQLKVYSRSIRGDVGEAFGGVFEKHLERCLERCWRSI